METLKAKTLDWMKKLRRPFGRLTVIVEAAGSGLSLCQYLAARPDESFMLIPYRPKSSKVDRVRMVLPYFELGVRILSMPGRNAWVEPYLSEFMAFPDGAKDDWVDSLVQIFCTNMVRCRLEKPKTNWDLV